MRVLILISGIFVLLAACSKGAGGSSGGGNNEPHVINAQDTVPPVIEINTPVADQVFTSGSVINITGKVTDTEGLYQGKVVVTNDATGAMLKEQLYEIHGTTLYNFSVAYASSVTISSDLTVTVTYEDHGLNITTRSVKIKVNP